MKALVCISHVPDTTTKIKYNAEGNALDTNGVTFVINPHDEYGLVRAIEFKESGGQGSITVLCVGGAEVEPTLRKALAIGADDAVRIDAQAADARSVANMIADYAKDQGFDAIFFGKESIDYNGSAVPGMVAELLDLPFVSNATKMDSSDGKAQLNREISGGFEVVESSLPVVVSCQKGMSEWRIPNMRGIMMARKKQLQVVPGTATAYISTTKLEIPPSKAGCTYVDADDAGKLIELLSDKGVI